MAEATPPHRPLPIIRGKEVEVALILKEVRALIADIPDATSRRGMENAWSVAVAMANTQDGSGIWNARGEDLLAQLGDAHSGHLVAAMALYMSFFPVTSDGAVHILLHARRYVAYVVANTPR
jgi:hypothetical protein